MGLSQKDRKRVWEKSGGKCWYCGHELPQRWHADHFVPIIRKGEYVPGDKPYTLKYIQTGGSYREEHDTFDNLVPACPSCNVYKSTFSIEGMRKNIGQEIERARKRAGFKIAERFGLISTEEKPVIFWFEKQNMP